MIATRQQNRRARACTGILYGERDRDVPIGRPVVRPGQSKRTRLKSRAIEIDVSGDERWKIGHGAYR
jgi:hypothetical protein